GLSLILVESGEKRAFDVRAPGLYLSAPAFSPDGKNLAFACGSGFLSADVCAAPLSDGKVRTLTSLRANIGTEAWTADGQRVVFSSNHQGIPSLWEVPVSGGPAQPLPFSSDDASGASVSRRGYR